MRGKRAPKRKIDADPVYGSELVTKMVNLVMLDGKKSVSKKVVYRALEELGKQTKSDPIEALEMALDKVKPSVEIRSRRVGGANYQVPTPVRSDRQVALALRWIIRAARQHRGNKPIGVALGSELVAAHKGEGDAMRKKQDVEKMAEANKAFAHFAW